VFIAIVLIERHGLDGVVGYIASQTTGTGAQYLRLQITRATVTPTTGPVQELIGLEPIVRNAALARQEHLGQIVAPGRIGHGAVHQGSIGRRVGGGSETNVAKEVGRFLMASFKEGNVFGRGKARHLKKVSAR
jgi:hypothetical protein